MGLLNIVPFRRNNVFFLGKTYRFETVRWLSRLPAVFTEEDGERYGWTDFYSIIRGIDPAFIEYLNSFVSWCEERDVQVYFTLPCYYAASVPEYCGEEVMDEFDSTLQSLLSAPLISRSVDYVFPQEYIYEEVHHCNTAGAEYRTRLLVRDLMPVLSEAI